MGDLVPLLVEVGELRFDSLAVLVALVDEVDRGVPHVVHATRQLILLLLQGLGGQGLTTLEHSRLVNASYFVSPVEQRLMLEQSTLVISYFVLPAV